VNKLRIEYEEMFAHNVTAIGARAFTRGRQALVILLKALGVSNNDNVGICGYTCLSVPEAVIRCGARCVFLDIDKFLTIDPNNILNSANKNLKVVIVQHTFGNPGNLKEILEACRKIGAFIIEDCSQAFGGEWEGKPLGSFGDGAIYSFQWGKPYTTGQGGMLTVNSLSLLERVDKVITEIAKEDSIASDIGLAIQRFIYKSLFNTSLFRFAKRGYFLLQKMRLIKGSFDLKLEYSLYPGYVRKAGPLMSYAGIQQLKKWKINRSKKMLEFCKIVDQSSGYMKPWPIPEKAKPVLLRYPFFVKDKERILYAARKKGLDIAGWFETPVHPLSGDDLEKVGYHQGTCPYSEYVASTIIQIPINAKGDESALKFLLSYANKKVFLSKII